MQMQPLSLWMNHSADSFKTLIHSEMKYCHVCCLEKKHNSSFCWVFNLLLVYKIDLRDFFNLKYNSWLFFHQIKTYTSVIFAEAKPSWCKRRTFYDGVIFSFSCSYNYVLNKCLKIRIVIEYALPYSLFACSKMAWNLLLTFLVIPFLVKDGGWKTYM